VIGELAMKIPKPYRNPPVRATILGPISGGDVVLVEAAFEHLQKNQVPELVMAHLNIDKATLNTISRDELVIAPR
jgi:hypothetical protein